MTKTLDIFISSKMAELKVERDILYDLIASLNYGDIKLRAWVFENDAPASNQSIRDVYLKALEDSALYIGLFWNLYGEWTIDEFDRASEWGIERHIYVKDVQADKRDPQLKAFLDKHGSVTEGITAKWFKTSDELRKAVTQSIEIWIAERLYNRPAATSATFASDPDDLTEKPRKLIGRDDLKADVTRLLDAGERVLLQGFGGQGKTALAATLGAEWISAGKGSLLWLRTGSASAEALFEALARPFDASQAIASKTGDSKNTLMRQIFRGSGARLLVLDDCWNGAALNTVLKAVPSDMPVLVTARHRYPIEGQVQEVEQLQPGDALALLGYHAGQETPTPTLPRVQGRESEAEGLCKVLGYHAFALEIAGKTLKANQWTAGDLLKRIEAAPEQMSLPLEFAQEGRESVAKLIEVSLKALDAVRGGCSWRWGHSSRRR